MASESSEQSKAVTIVVAEIGSGLSTTTSIDTVHPNVSATW